MALEQFPGDDRDEDRYGYPQRPHSWIVRFLASGLLTAILAWGGVLLCAALCVEFWPYMGTVK